MKEILEKTRVGDLEKKKAAKKDGRIIIYYKRSPVREEE